MFERKSSSLLVQLIHAPNLSLANNLLVQLIHVCRETLSLSCLLPIPSLSCLLHQLACSDTLPLASPGSFRFFPHQYQFNLSNLLHNDGPNQASPFDSISASIYAFVCVKQAGW
ncbi:unnamed protein product [Linum trigynum]|uniref:Uncharacterized protein n=1 Tax=Linum trigynum TaxID=586398 RepID=A0AAV2F8W2_9ROSI